MTDPHVDKAEARHGEPDLESEAAVSSSLPVAFHVQSHVEVRDHNEPAVVHTLSSRTRAYAKFTLFWGLCTLPFAVLGIVSHSWQLTVMAWLMGVPCLLSGRVAVRSWLHHRRIEVKDASLTVWTRGNSEASATSHSTGERSRT